MVPTHAPMFRCGPNVYEIVHLRNDLRVQAASEEDVVAWREERGADVPSIDLPLSAILACFDAPNLLRAQRVAKLSTIKRVILFGRRREWSASGARLQTRHELGRQLYRVGKAIPGDEGDGCGKCETVEDACHGCGKKIVAEALRDAPFTVLLAAARHVHPREQLAAANEAHVRVMLERSSKKNKAMRTKRAIPRRGGTEVEQQKTEQKAEAAR